MPNNDPWLLAVWPGMGSVALLAGTYLRSELDARFIKEFEPGRHFDISSVEVRDGMLQVPGFPSSKLYGWENPEGRDLLIMVGESQPDQAGFEYCLKLVETARELGVKRVFTFAASLAKLGPDETPGIMAATTHGPLRRELEAANIRLMGRGHITGLNGVFLGAAASRGLEGTCLLGEIPFYAAPLPIPRTSLVLLQTFGKLAGVELPLEGLKLKAESSRSTIEAIFRMYEQAAMAASDPMMTSRRDHDEEDEADEELEEEPEVPTPPPDALARIEQLFEEAGKDREHALELKRELDRWHLFKAYEDRFLDLFSRDDS